MNSKIIAIILAAVLGVGVGAGGYYVADLNNQIDELKNTTTTTTVAIQEEQTEAVTNNNDDATTVATQKNDNTTKKSTASNTTKKSSSNNSGSVTSKASSNSGTTKSSSSSNISASKAKEIALDHAGFSSSQVSGLRAEFDYDDGVPEYSVEFRKGNYEYDYDIHAKTGKIRSYDKDYDDDYKPANATKKATTTKKTTTASSSNISSSKAKNIALDHASFSSSQVTGLRAEFDYDDGRAEYNVEFRKGNYEYDYEINAKTGKIISYDKDYDDPYDD